MKNQKRGIKIYLQCKKSGGEKNKTIPLKKEFTKWIKKVFEMAPDCFEKPVQIVELTVRLVDKPESAELNQTYRHKTGPTNILSFPAHSFFEIEPFYLGDMVICAPLVLEEAHQQNKDIRLHWAHLTVHGVLHLLGYDHEVELDAAVMEGWEINILKELGYQNPYEI